MITVQFPEPQFRIKKENNQHYIFDALRKMWLVLTEEEWVRQNFVNYLVTRLNYPSAVIALEKEIKLNELKKRFDVLVYDRNHNPWMLIECKAPEVPLNEETLQQVLRYHISVPVNFLVITNGQTTVAWKKTGGALELLNEMPSW